MTEKYVGVAIKTESTDTKGTTEDERYVFVEVWNIQMDPLHHT
jgi:hypothetical protein